MPCVPSIGSPRSGSLDTRHFRPGVSEELDARPKLKDWRNGKRPLSVAPKDLFLQVEDVRRITR